MNFYSLGIDEGTSSEKHKGHHLISNSTVYYLLKTYRI